MIVRKLRLQRGWTQEQLAEFTGLSTRSIQRLERGGRGSLESLKALAAVFEVDLSTLQPGDDMMNTQINLPQDEAEAMEYVKGIKEFWNHVLMYAFFVVVFCGVFGMAFGFTNPRITFIYLGLLGWGVGVLVHGLNAYEFISFFGPAWERKLIEKRLKRKL